MRYILQVSSRAMPGREADYDTWYEETHMGEVLALDGFVACERFRRTVPGQDGPAEFVANYEVETDDPGALLQSLFAAAPDMNLTDSIDPASARFEFLEPIGGGRRLKA